MIQEAKYFTESIEENINRLTEEVASNTSKWFDKLKDQFRRMDDVHLSQEYDEPSTLWYIDR